MRKVMHLFAGIGGGLLADIQNGLTPVGVCEFDPDAQKVLKARFPQLPLFPDVRELTGKQIVKACGKVHRLSGGSPCQSLSVNGKKAGFGNGEVDDDIKSSLIWAQVRLLKELDADELFWENTCGALGDLHKDGLLKFFKMLTDAGYGAAYCTLSTGHFGGNHARDRVWLLAKKGFKGVHEVPTTPVPPRKYFHTPVAADGTRGHDPMPANLRRNSPNMPTQVFMPRIRTGMTMEEIRAIVGDHRINPAWVEQGLAFPPDWTNLTVNYTAENIAVNLKPTWDYPAPFLAKRRKHEYPMTVPVSDAEFPAWSARMKQLGNCQDRLVAAHADKLLSAYVRNHRTLF